MSRSEIVRMMTRRSLLLSGLVLALAVTCVRLVPHGLAAQQAELASQQGNPPASINQIAERYVKLVLAVGEHDPLYVDAYSGPEAWRIKAKEERKPLAAIEREATVLLAELQKLEVSGREQFVRPRRTFLIKQLESLAARTRTLRGTRYSFDEESMALYGIAAPPFNEKNIKAILARLDSLLPSGAGSLVNRLERYQKDFVIPKDKVAAVFAATIDEARRRTRRYIALPENESFAIECVTNKPWVAYNWYKGDCHSVIQLNTDLSHDIDSLVHLACHEGYPGHHVQNVIFEQRLVKERGWVEYIISPLFSRLSPMIEGSAEFGAEVVFPGGERLDFERSVLYPLAGLDAAKAASYDAIMTLVGQLGSAQNEAGRRYLNGRFSAEDAAQFLHAYALMPFERARKRVAFMDQYGSYFVNLVVGYDLVKNHIERRGGTQDHPEKCWEEYAALISEPRVLSEVK
jgi:hypothetical protein